jgi:hypothetical protein
LLADALAGTDHATTRSLAEAVRRALPHRMDEEERDVTVRRVFQALRIAVNEEFTALDTFLHQLPNCLRPGARVAILTFHSGEDRRVKHLFRDGLRSGIFSAANDEVIRPSSQETRDNPRAAPAKLRWALRVGAAEFRVYHFAHCLRIGFMIVPMFLTELGTAAWLFYEGMRSTPFLISLAMFPVICLSTAIWQAPMHTKLADGRDETIIRRLIATNWLRTFAWTARGVLLGFMML